jgi:manganese efflux pump family protein
VWRVVALLIVAVALGLSNLAAAVGIGMSGVSGALRVRVAVVFGVFEAGMPLLGLLLGHGVAGSLGHTARWLGGALLIAVGGYSCWQAWHGGESDAKAAGPASVPAAGQASMPADWRLGRMVVSGLALSIDNLTAGFALGAYQVPLGVAAAVIGTVSVAMSLAGLELGGRLGGRLAVGKRSEVAAGAVLVAVGAAMAAGAL